LEEAVSSWRGRVTRMFLWISVLSWEVLVRGKLFDLCVLGGASSASQLQSLSLLPCVSRLPIDAGESFFPRSIALLGCSFGGLIAGGSTPSKSRSLPAGPAVMLLVTLLFKDSGSRRRTQRCGPSPEPLRTPRKITRRLLSS
jgi:hypothetical protein